MKKIINGRRYDTVHISMEKSKLESIRRKASENGMNLSEYIASSLS